MREGQHFDSSVIKNSDNPRWGEDDKGEEFGFLVRPCAAQQPHTCLPSDPTQGPSDAFGCAGHQSGLGSPPRARSKSRLVCRCTSPGTRR